MPELQLHCTCGAKWAGALPEGVDTIFREMWDSAHAGEGHAPCDAATARRARAKAERQAAKEQAE